MYRSRCGRVVAALTPCAGAEPQVRLVRDRAVRYHRVLSACRRAPAPAAGRRGLDEPRPMTFDGAASGSTRRALQPLLLPLSHSLSMPIVYAAAAASAAASASVYAAAPPDSSI